MDSSLWLLLFLNLADITLTKFLVELGALELNPIMRYLLAIDFVWALLFKVVVVALFIAVTHQAIKESRLVKGTVIIANTFFSLLVVYQLVGLAYLS